MKRTLVIPGIMLALFISICLQSCSEKFSDKDELVEENIILFEDLSMLENVSTNPLDNHIYRIELLGNGDCYEALISELENQNVDLSQINSQGVRKHYMNHSDVVMYSLPYNNSENKLIVYQYDNLYQVVVSSVEKKANGHQQYRLNTLDGRLYYGLSVNENNEVGAFVKGENPQIQVFSNNVSQLSIGHGLNGRTEMKVKDNDTCCRQMEDWKACFDCTMTFFSGKWYGILAIATIGPEFVASVGVSCIGARPSAVC